MASAKMQPGEPTSKKVQYYVNETGFYDPRIGAMVTPGRPGTTDTYRPMGQSGTAD